jgi:hypothetical protein
MRWGGGIKNSYNKFVGRTERKTPLGIRRFRWEDNIRMDLTEIG